MHKLIFLPSLVATLVLAGCTAIVTSQTMKLADNIDAAINNSSDIDTVSKAVPTFLLLIDGLIQDDPNNSELLATSASLYSSYAGFFDNNSAQAKVLADRSLAYALKAACIDIPALCEAREIRYPVYEKRVSLISAKQLSSAYTLAVSWLAWIQANSSDWNAIAELSRPKLLLRRVIALDENHENGSAHVYLAVMESLLPPALGGKPELGKQHFERAWKLSDGRNQMINVLYAQYYARLTFNRKLHHRLLMEVIESNPNIPDFVLINTMAIKQAKVLLNSENDYF